MKAIFSKTLTNEASPLDGHFVSASRTLNSMQVTGIQVQLLSTWIAKGRNHKNCLSRLRFNNIFSN